MADESAGDGQTAFQVHCLIAVAVLHGRDNLLDFRSLLAGLIASAWDAVLGDE